jgi:hypothetical protein
MKAIILNYKKKNTSKTSGSSNFPLVSFDSTESWFLKKANLLGRSRFTQAAGI